MQEPVRSPGLIHLHPKGVVTGSVSGRYPTLVSVLFGFSRNDFGTAAATEPRRAAAAGGDGSAESTRRKTSRLGDPRGFPEPLVLGIAGTIP